MLKNIKNLTVSPSPAIVGGGGPGVLHLQLQGGDSRATAHMCRAR